MLADDLESPQKGRNRAISKNIPPNGDQGEYDVMDEYFNLYPEDKKKMGMEDQDPENLQEQNEEEEKDEPAPEEPQVDIHTEDDDDINWKEVIKLIEGITNIILASFKKNDLNHLYCSQFVRVPI